MNFSKSLQLSIPEHVRSVRFDESANAANSIPQNDRKGTLNFSENYTLLLHPKPKGSSFYSGRYDKKGDTMDKHRVKISSFLLAMILCLVLPQTSAIAKKPVYRAKWRQPNPKVTIVLRAPTSEHPYLVKFSETEGTEVIKGTAVSLPLYTPVFFSIDLVNTALYTVRITAEKPKAGKAPERFRTFSVGEASRLIENARKHCPKVSGNNDLDPLDRLRCKIEEAGKLNKKLDVLLQKTENAGFYNRSLVEVNTTFTQMVIDAQEKTKKALRLQHGTSQEICDDAESVLKEVHSIYKNKSKAILKYVPEDLSNPSNAIATVFVAIAEKLRAIETTAWAREDTQERLLKHQIKYTCVFTPRVNNTKLKSITREVTVNPKAELSGIRFTVGPFITDLHDDHYISRDSKIALGSQDRVSMPLGGLAHVILCGVDSRKFSSALALSTGFALGTTTTDGAFVVNGQAALGASLLFSAPGGEGNICTLTLGGIAKPVKRLDGYWVGDTLPAGSVPPVRSVYRVGMFFALTANFDFLPKIFGLKAGSSSSK